jgi:hypothetical protein
MNNPNHAAQDDTAALVALERHVTFAGEQVTVRPLNIGQIIQVSAELKALLPAADQLLSLADSEKDLDGIGAVLGLLADYGPAVLRIVRVATGIPEDRLQSANDVSGLALLIIAMVRINLAFFQAQASGISAALAEAAQAFRGASPTPSTALSAPATH